MFQVLTVVLFRHFCLQFWPAGILFAGWYCCVIPWDVRLVQFWISCCLASVWIKRPVPPPSRLPTLCVIQSSCYRQKCAVQRQSGSWAAAVPKTITINPKIVYTRNILAAPVEPSKVIHGCGWWWRWGRLASIICHHGGLIRTSPGCPSSRPWLPQVWISTFGRNEISKESFFFFFFFSIFSCFFIYFFIFFLLYFLWFEFSSRFKFFLLKVFFFRYIIYIFIIFLIPGLWCVLCWRCWRRPPCLHFVTTIWIVWKWPHLTVYKDIYFKIYQIDNTFAYWQTEK